MFNLVPVILPLITNLYFVSPTFVLQSEIYHSKNGVDFQKVVTITKSAPIDVEWIVPIGVTNKINLFYIKHN